MEIQVFALLMAAILIAGESVNYPGEQNTVFTEAEEAEGDVIYQYPSRPEGQIYYDITNEYYEHAFTLVEQFLRRDPGIIKRGIDELIKDHRIHVATFAYKLFAAGKRKVVEDHFPVEYRMVFNDTKIKLTNNRYPHGMEFDGRPDLINDEKLVGYVNANIFDNYVWKLEPVEEGKKVFFKIRHIGVDRYMKLGTYADRNGLHQAYGSMNSNTHRHQWMFQPVDFNGKLSFCIINREYYQSLKYANYVSWGGRRFVFSLGGYFYEYVEEHGWQVDVKSIN